MLTTSTVTTINLCHTLTISVKTDWMTDGGKMNILQRNTPADMKTHNIITLKTKLVLAHRSITAVSHSISVVLSRAH